MSVNDIRDENPTAGDAVINRVNGRKYTFVTYSLNLEDEKTYVILCQGSSLRHKIIFTKLSGTTDITITLPILIMK